MQMGCLYMHQGDEFHSSIPVGINSPKTQAMVEVSAGEKCGNGLHVPEEPCSRWLALEAFLWETHSDSLKLTLGDSHTWLCHVK